MPNILIAGGGSGGHVAPAIASAESLTAMGANVLLAHSNRIIDFNMMDSSPFDSVVLPASPLSMKPIGFVRFCQGFLRASSQVKRIIKEKNIDCILATGGFVSAPALHAGRKAGCKTVMLNLDDPPGKANKLAVRWADSVLTTVPCELKNAVSIAPPLRQSVITTSSSIDCKKSFGLNPNRMTLLVTGASQGASTINQLLPSLAKLHPSIFHGWEILHIAGNTHADSVKQAWRDADVPCTVLGFIQNMGEAWGAADIAITRGGANTIAEISINTVPSIVLPYPYHQDDHQRTNAEPLEKIGGVRIAKDHTQLDLNLQDAGLLILELLKDHQARFSMRQSMIESPSINGADEIALACLSSPH